MQLNNKFDVVRFKNMIHEIIDEESKKENLDVNVFPVTFIQYFKDCIFKSNFSLQEKKELAFSCINASGMNYKDNIMIFLNGRIIRKEHSLFEILTTVYHELRHSMQTRMSEYGYECFLYSIEDYLRLGTCGTIDYRNNHDVYSYEIGANLYGVGRAKEFLQTRYPEIYAKEEDYIRLCEKKCLFSYYMYDASTVFDIAVPIIRAQMKKGNSNSIIKFFNEDGSFKSVECLLDDPWFCDLDDRIVSAVVSSMHFLSELNFEELSSYELEFISEMLDYANNIYDNQNNFLDKKFNDGELNEKTYKFIKSSLLKKIEILNNYIKKVELYINKINNVSDEEKISSTIKK